MKKKAPVSAVYLTGADNLTQNRFPSQSLLRIFPVIKTIA